MIKEEEIREVGQFGTPHGINGELNASFDADVDIEALSCIIVEIDGIYVPFFIQSLRSRGATAVLLTIDGISNENEASLLARKPIFALKNECTVFETDEDVEDGFYAEDLIGYKCCDTDKKFSGLIVSIDDSTANVLFVIEAKGYARPLLVPVADEYIADLNPGNKSIVFELPEGFLDI